ncbi:MAG: DUF1674 domain-containing protein [Porphyrobacter sp.]|nr:DUF1674 domain-containing protein [Porphyrobacter sp.]
MNRAVRTARRAKVFRWFIVARVKGAGAGLADAQFVDHNAAAQAEDAVTDHPTPEEPHAPTFNADVPHATPERPLPEAARRALLEAAARRQAARDAPMAVEHGGPRGPGPTRYGDWEKKGLAVDF